MTPKGEGAPTYIVRVTFGLHCFTRDPKEEDTPDLHVIHEGEKRCFCFDRYELSKELVDALKYAANGRAYFTQRANFLILESLSQHNAPYAIFFDVEKAKKADGYDGLRAQPRRRRLPKDGGDRQLETMPANLQDRQVAAKRPNQKWIADFTYLWTAEGWL